MRRTTARFAVSAIAGFAGAGLLGGAALAAQHEAPQQQQQQQTQQQQQQQGFDVSNWDPKQAYQGWSAEQMMDQAEVYGSGGEEIGSIENLLIDEQGQVVALIAEVGGFWDIGDTHVAVPWKEVSFENGRVNIPVTEENVEEYSVMDERFFTKKKIGELQRVEEDVETGSRIWKATDLMDDYAVTRTGEAYGYVNDLIFDDKGQLQAVVVNARNVARPGFRSYPWLGGREDYAWEPGMDRYVLPFEEAELVKLDNEFDYDQMRDDTGVAGTRGGEAGEGGAGADVGATPEAGQQDSPSGQGGQSGNRQ